MAVESFFPYGRYILRARLPLSSRCRGNQRVVTRCGGAQSAGIEVWVGTRDTDFRERNRMRSETRPAKVGKWTDAALRVLRERYLSRQGGEVIETPEEMCWRVATSIAEGEARYGRSP